MKSKAHNKLDEEQIQEHYEKIKNTRIGDIFEDVNEVVHVINFIIFII